MHRVLMPVDSSESRGVAQARAVTELPRATEDVHVTLLYVFDDPERARTTSTTQVKGGRVARERLREAGVSVEATSRTGDPATEILDAAEAVDADHLVLGGRKRSPMGALLFGSVSQAVILDSDRAVTVTGGEK